MGSCTIDKDENKALGSALFFVVSSHKSILYLSAHWKRNRLRRLRGLKERSDGHYGRQRRPLRSVSSRLSRGSDHREPLISFQNSKNLVK